MAKSTFVPAIVPGERPGQAGGARERNRLARTQAICVAAIDLFLAAGIHATTVDEITRSAGVAKGTFYRYFADKGQLVESLFQPLRTEVLACLARCHEGVMQAENSNELRAVYMTLALTMSELLLTEPQLTRLYLQECRAPAQGAGATIAELGSQLRDAVVAMTEVAKQKGLLRDLPAPLVAVAVMGAIESLLMQHFTGFELGEPMEGAEALLRLIMDGLR